MNEIPLLSGKAFKRTLPVIEGRPGREAPRLKRLLLPQGELAQIYDGQPGIQYLAYVELVERAIRGNHYHKTKAEFIYVLKGRIQLTLEDLSTNEREATELVSGDLVFIPTMIAHAFETMESGHGLEFSPQSFFAEDTFPHEVIHG